MAGFHGRPQVAGDGAVASSRFMALGSSTRGLQQSAARAGKVRPAQTNCPSVNLPAPRQHSLLCHPASPCAAVRTLQVAAAFTADGDLALCYRLDGDLDGIRLPAQQSSAQSDGLWQHTCCEAFIAAVDAAEYREFNFSPAGQWANYRFRAYRERDASFASPTPPQITCRRLDDGFQLDALLGRELLPASAALQIGLSAVIETIDGSKSYWALAHASAQPDFHCRQSFTLTLPTPKP